ncbi:MAG: hypothetical protein RIS79_1804 [Verrucomicrobiota bacterium]|jgi:hypothetical protein
MGGESLLQCGDFLSLASLILLATTKTGLE